MRTIGVVTVGRSDYGILQPILRALKADPELRVLLYVGGMHLAPEFGNTVRMVEADGYEIAARVEMLLASDNPEGIAKSVGLGVIGFAQAYAARRPDILLVLGDRFEVMAAALAALPAKIPLAHLHGGEVTEGAMDEAFRHCITKLSHLHFVTTQEYFRRVAQLGEEPWRITLSGAPGLDHLRTLKLLSADELARTRGVKVQPAPLLVTFHPVTLEHEQTEWQTTELLVALADSELPIIFTLPNADTNGRTIIKMVQQFVSSHPKAQLVGNLGTEAYLSLMALAAAMVGNSSSGIIEAASLKLPVVNIGNRQRGRVRAANVIDVGHARKEVLRGILEAVSLGFRARLKDLVNPYGQGEAAGRIVRVLKTTTINDRLLMKRFSDVPLSLAA
jgi:UDP-hydrolysing UDP-N-acetyl-D-glucosamine 2-epimerase